MSLFKTVLEKYSFWIFCGLLILFKLWLAEGRFLEANINWVHDDGHYFKQAVSISSGEWLGQYNQNTLIKGVGFPLWIALVYQIGIPLQLSFQLLYIFAVVLFLVAIRPISRSNYVRVIVFALLLFNPIHYFGRMVDSFSRQFINLPVALIIAALCIGLLLRHTYSTKRLVYWSFSLGIVVGFFRIIRGEYVWIMPLLAFVLFGGIGHFWRRQKSKLIRLLLSFVISAMLVPISIRLINHYYYGAFVIDEFSASEFTAAYGSLTRVEPSRSLPHIPVQKEVWQLLGEKSDMFAVIEPYLESDSSLGWVNNSNEGLFGNWQQGLPEEWDEIGGGWFVFALRDAVWESGNGRTLSDALSFYKGMADEINEICNDTLLPCISYERNSLSPPITRSVLTRMYNALPYGLTVVLKTPSLQVEENYRSDANPSDIAFVKQYTHTDKVVGVDQTKLSLNKQYVKQKHILTILTSFYQVISPIFLVVSLMLYFQRLLKPHKNRIYFCKLMLSSGLLASLAMLLTINLLVEVTSFPALHHFYMAPTHIFMWAFIVIESLFFLEEKSKRTISVSNS